MVCIIYFWRTKTTLQKIYLQEDLWDKSIKRYVSNYAFTLR